jgi:hypothetical protein
MDCGYNCFIPSRDVSMDIDRLTPMLSHIAN